jgi:hypothetical protein
MPSRLTSILLAGILALPVCAEQAITQPRPGGAPVTMAGCYALTLGPWTPPLRAREWPASQTPPAEFELDTAIVPRLSGRDTARAVRPATLVVTRGLYPATWRVVTAGDISVVWSTGFTGVKLRLRVTGDTLRGDATTFHDAHWAGEPPDPQASVVAVRRRCTVR